MVAVFGEVAVVGYIYWHVIVGFSRAIPGIERYFVAVVASAAHAFVAFQLTRAAIPFLIYIPA